MAKESLSSDDAIIGAVKRLNSDYPDNKNFKVKQATKIAGGLLHPVSFQGGNGDWYENYVFQRGSTLKAYSGANDLLKDYTATIAPLSDPDFIRLWIVGGIAIFFAMAVVLSVFLATALGIDGKSVSVLTGVFGTAFGYLVGRPARVDRH